MVKLFASRPLRLSHCSRNDSRSAQSKNTVAITFGCGWSRDCNLATRWSRPDVPRGDNQRPPVFRQVCASLAPLEFKTQMNEFSWVAGLCNLSASAVVVHSMGSSPENQHQRRRHGQEGGRHVCKKVEDDRKGSTPFGPRVLLTRSPMASAPTKEESRAFSALSWVASPPKMLQRAGQLRPSASKFRSFKRTSSCLEGSDLVLSITRYSGVSVNVASHNDERSLSDSSVTATTVEGKPPVIGT